MRYSTVDVYFMSGTGNSFRVAGWFAREAGRGALARLIPLNAENRPRSPAPGKDGLVVLVYPTHGFTAPWNVIWFALRMPFGRGTHAAAVATRAGTKLFGVRFPGLDGTAAYIVALALLLRGYAPRGAIGIDMPSNWMAIHPSMGPEKVKDIIAHARPKSRRFIGRLLGGRAYFGSWISLPLGLLLAPVSAGYVLYARFWLAKLFFATEACNSCGLCVSDCGFKAVKLLGKPPRPYWTYACESCMRCMAFCPREAIEVSHSFAVLIGLTVSWLTPLVVLPLAGPGGLLPGLNFLLQWLVFAATLFAAYAVVWRLMGFAIVNRFFRFTTLTPLFMRYREPSVRVKDMLKSETFRER